MLLLTAVQQAAEATEKATTTPADYINMGIGIATAVTALLIALFRFKDRAELASKIGAIDEALKIMPDVNQCLDTLSRKYVHSVSFRQAKDLVFNACATSELIIKCWCCRFMRKGMPAFDDSMWSVQKTTKGQYLATIDRLDGFEYKGHPIKDFVLKEDFEAIAEEIETNIRNYAEMRDVETMLAAAFSNIVRAACERMNNTNGVAATNNGGTTDG